ncbi:MAG: dihydrodipicolinate synthase family protein [Clostridia bacterium]|nr:dihydrodipicolinate synthase family protein [Clostridia bacterium]
MKNIQFTGIRSAIFTPLNADGSVNTKMIKPLVDFGLDRGLKGFYVVGSTGEGPALSAEARMEATAAVVEACKSRKTVYGDTPDVIVHVAAPDTYDAFKLAKHAKECGADAISSLAPNFYATHNAQEMLDYYKRLTAISDLPLLIYATGLLTGSVGGSLKAFIEEAMKIEHIIGLKYTIRDYHQLNVLKTINDGDINIINGPDETLLGGLAMGADGGIGSTYNLVPQWFVKIWDLYHEGKMEEARVYQTKVNKLIGALASFNGGYLTAAKNAMKFLGLDIGTCAYPAMTYSADELKKLEATVKAAGLEF